ncbi:MAG TPA: SRPBCC family protein [Candidatus Udaeobacter sp.]|nr:SRPBCC family protein [Candidatus Udaeobacter sp.]
MNAPVERTYAQWARIEDLPEFVTLLRNVQRINDTQFSYTWGPHGEERHGVLHIVLQIPCRRIAWRMLSDPLMSGIVSFERRSKEETEVTLKIRSVFDSPKLSLRLEEYLGNFKRLVESEDAAK